MNNLIRRIILEEINESNPLSDLEIILFKHLNNIKERMKTKHELIAEIKTMCRVLGLETDKAQYYYDLYTFNYREDNAYDKLTNKDFKGPEWFRAKKTTNTGSWEYTRAKMPFQGSNLKGYWDVDSKKRPFYVVVSYNWYPVFLFKEDRWYEINDKYSRSTIKQMGQVNPVKYEEGLGRNVIMVSRSEMDDLMRYSADYDTIMKKKVSKLMANKPQILANKSAYTQILWGDAPQRVQYKITDLSELDDKVLVTITVDDAGKMEGRKYIPSNGGYLKGEVPGVTKETTENLINSDVSKKLSDYIGDKKNKNIEFNFIHSKE